MERSVVHPNTRLCWRYKNHSPPPRIQFSRHGRSKSVKTKRKSESTFPWKCAGVIVSVLITCHGAAYRALSATIRWKATRALSTLSSLPSVHSPPFSLSFYFPFPLSSFLFLFFDSYFRFPPSFKYRF